jgi:N-acylneuraminate cytidylyltransferase
MVSRVVVSTDDPAIAEVAREWGAEVPFMRPPELATDDSPEWLAWRHAIQTIREQGGGIEIMVSVPTVSPLRAPEDVAGCLQKLLATGADIALTLTPARENPYFVMMRPGPSGDLQRLMSHEAPVTRRQAAPPVYTIVPLAYAVRADFVLVAENMYAGRMVGHLVPHERAVDIDTPFDFDLAEFLLRRRGGGDQ